MPTFIKYYSVDLKKYKDKIRLITDDYPYQNEKETLFNGKIYYKNTQEI